MDQQAAGGEDPNKPSKKKSSEDESKNKKLVCIVVFELSCLLLLFLSFDTTRDFVFQGVIPQHGCHPLFFQVFIRKVHVNKNKASVFILMLLELPITTPFKLESACYC